MSLLGLIREIQDQNYVHADFLKKCLHAEVDILHNIAVFLLESRIETTQTCTLVFELPANLR